MKHIKNTNTKKSLIKNFQTTYLVYFRRVDDILCLICKSQSVKRFVMTRRGWRNSRQHNSPTITTKAVLQNPRQRLQRLKNIYIYIRVDVRVAGTFLMTVNISTKYTPTKKYIERGYYTVARRYEFYARVARTISHE